MEYTEAKITKITPIGKSASIISVKHTAAAFPGQYVMAWIPGSGEISLPIASRVKNEYEFLITKDVGITRKTLWVMEKSFILIRGPFGHGFPMNNLKKTPLTLIGEPQLFSPLLFILSYAKNKEEYDVKKAIILHSEEEKDFAEHIKKNNEWKKNYVECVNEKTWLAESFLSDEKQTYLLSLSNKNLKKLVLNLKAKKISPKNVYYYIPRKIRCGEGNCGTCAAYGIHTCIDGPVIRADLIEDLWK